MGIEDRDSRHLYDICKLLNCVDLNSPQMDELIDRVRKDRMFSKNNPSAQLQYNIPEMLNEIIDSRFYESDYKNITQRLIYEDIDYCGATRFETDPESYPMMWLYIAGGVLIGLIAVIVILIVVKKKKK